MLPLLQARGLRQSYPAPRELVVVVTVVHKSVPFACDSLRVGNDTDATGAGGLVPILMLGRKVQMYK